MKKSTKPMSSPGRTEKFPPPLMRFLRSNMGSKSSRRGRRSRASPIFFRKKTTNIETTQEPSSPKVTCIGQVRVRRSKKNKKTTTASSTTTATALHRHQSNRLCRCFKKLKPKSYFSVLGKWVSFFRCGYCKNSSFVHDSPAIEGTPRSVSRNSAGDNGEEHEQEQEQEQQEDDINQGLISRSPPKNAFLLTRCRSAPYRSSSLANKFWESTMEKTGEEEIAEKIENLKINKEDEFIEGENEVNEEGICNENIKVEELKAIREIKVVPLILKRCKSEPARTCEQLLV